MSHHLHWDQTTPHSYNYAPRADAASTPEYSYQPKTAPRNDLGGYRESPSTPSTPYPSIPGAFEQDPYSSWPANDHRHGHPEDAYQSPTVEHSSYNIYSRPASPSRPKYVGRTRSRASSQLSSTGAGRAQKLDRSRHKPASYPRGYKAPTVESVPNSPPMLPTLPSDEDCVFMDNPDYTAPESGYSSPVSDAVRPKKTHRPLREFIIVPDAATSATESTAPSSPPSECESISLKRREPRQYAIKRHDSIPPPIERKPQPYSYSPKAEKRTPEKSTSYAASGANLSHRREDPRAGGVPSSPASSWRADSALGNTSPIGMARHAAQLVQRPASPDEEDDDLPPIPPCPGRQRVNNGHWWKLRYAPDFSVCEQCFEDDIWDTDFKDHFEEHALQDGETIFCSFNTPRIKRLVWPATLDDRSLDGFVAFVLARMKISPCTQVSSSKIGCWFQMPLSRPDLAMVACHACYEDVVRASKFTDLFHRVEPLSSHGMSTCHVSTAPFIEAHLLNEEITHEELKGDIEYRLTRVAQCPQDTKIVNMNLRWWKPKDTRLPLRICDACYCDGIYPTEFRDRFVDVIQQETDIPWFCCVGAYNLNLVWKHAVGKGDYNLWFEAACSALSPRCEPVPKPGGNWKLIDNPKFHKFSICTRCAETYFRPLGFEKYLIDKKTDKKTLSWCGLSTAYHQEIVRVLADAAHWGEFEIFLDYLHHRIASLPCPGEKEVVRDRWWMSEMAWFCEECYRFGVRASPFAKMVEGVRDKSPRRCDLGNINGRMLWLAACKKPYPKRAIEDFERGLVITDDLEDVRRRRDEVVKKEARAPYGETLRYRKRIADLSAEEMDLQEELKDLKL